MKICDTCTRPLAWDDAPHAPGTCKAARIVAAAITDTTGKVWTLPAPARHHDVIREMARNGVPALECEQGFVSDAGTFLRRPVARRLALQSGQIKGTRGPVLTSEDLW